ncbi:ATP-binding protein [Caulobacter sp. KR2-114]|uniref:ATP-binding protein n=1 Tax=Caulobacter sp. KR2-114 TaxID=3400912 RepID=UPI003C0D0ABF
MLLTDSLSTRITAVLLLVFALTAAAVAAVSLWPSPSAGRLFDLPLPDEAAAMVRALEGAPVDDRPAIIQALNTSVVSAELVDDFPPPRAGLHRAAGLEALYQHYAPAFAGRRFQVWTRPPRPLRALAGEDVDAPVRLLVSLQGGGVLVLERRPSRIARTYMARGGLTLALVGAALLAGLLLAVAQTTRPVGRLAGGVRAFAEALDAPDLPLTGPREIRDLSAAFNAMKGRIRGLVAERTRVLAAIAHDMRTYLTRLRLRAEFIADEAQRAKAVADLDDMAALLDDTLLFARDVSGPGAPAETFDLAAEVAEFAAVRAETGQPVSAAAPAGVLPLAATRLTVRRMLANLTDNALRYGGSARLMAGADASGTWLAVEDEGPGIPETELARMLQPFERLEGSRGRDTGGAGLGLAIVQALAATQGATLSLSNRAEGGLRAQVRWGADAAGD